jgi:pSer/pThr/pTyr-binding forkhead associated (FHA) protein
MKLSLVVLTEGKAAGQVISVTLSPFLIGRDPQCQLRPASAIISKRHCALWTKNNKVFVRDFDSTNGTFVNEEQIKGEKELKHEDQLKVGPLIFRVVIENAAPVAVNKPTPIPKVPNKESSDDESVAAMLLDLADEGGGGAPKGADGVPEGSTILELPSPFGAKAALGGANPDDGGKPAAMTPDKKKEMGNTSDAAQAILRKYMRRHRT